MNLKKLSVSAVLCMFMATGCGTMSDTGTGTNYNNYNNYNNTNNYGYNSTTAATTKSQQEIRQEIVSQARYVTYQELARSTNGMQGQAISVKGEISQVLEDTDHYEGLINITYVYSDYMEYYTDSIYYMVDKSCMNTRLLQGDVVTFSGQSLGLITYESVLGSPITVPCIDAYDVIMW